MNYEESSVSLFSTFVLLLELKLSSDEIKLEPADQEGVSIAEF